MTRPDVPFPPAGIRWPAGPISAPRSHRPGTGWCGADPRLRKHRRLPTGAGL